MILCFNRLHISAKQLYQLIPEGRHQPLKRMADHNEDQRRGYQRGQLVSRRSEKSCCLDWFLLFAIFFANFIRTAQVPHEDCAPSLWSFQPAGRRSCSTMTMLPVLTVWFESSGFNIFCLHFHFLFHLVNPAVEQGELGKVHDRLLRSKACVSFHLLVFFLLWVALTGRLDLCSKMVALTNCLHSGESLPVPFLELIWM